MFVDKNIPYPQNLYDAIRHIPKANKSVVSALKLPEDALATAEHILSLLPAEEEAYMRLLCVQNKSKTEIGKALNKNSTEISRLDKVVTQELMAEETLAILNQGVKAYQAQKEKTPTEVEKTANQKRQEREWETILLKDIAEKHGITLSVEASLESWGRHTLKALADTSIEELKQMNNIGAKSLAKLLDILKNAYGITLAPKKNRPLQKMVEIPKITRDDINHSISEYVKGNKAALKHVKERGSREFDFNELLKMAETLIVEHTPDKDTAQEPVEYKPTTEIKIPMTGKEKWTPTPAEEQTTTTKLSALHTERAKEEDLVPYFTDAMEDSEDDGQTFLDENYTQETMALEEHTVPVKEIVVETVVEPPVEKISGNKALMEVFAENTKATKELPQDELEQTEQQPEVEEQPTQTDVDTTEAEDVAYIAPEAQADIIAESNAEERTETVDTSTDTAPVVLIGKKKIKKWIAQQPYPQNLYNMIFVVSDIYSVAQWDGKNVAMPKDVMETLTKVFSSLTQLEEDVMVLQYKYYLQIPEMAEHLGIDKETVKATAKQAKKKLAWGLRKKMLQEGIGNYEGGENLWPFHTRIHL